MTPAQFIAAWKNNPLSERAGAQAHFDDLCDLLGVDKPRDHDNYCFERGGMTLLVKQVPAEICENCGEEYIDESASGQLLQTAEDAVRAGVQVELRQFAAA